MLNLTPVGAALVAALFVEKLILRRRVSAIEARPKHPYAHA